MNLFNPHSSRLHLGAFTALVAVAVAACGPVTTMDAGVTPRQSTRGTTTLLTPDDAIAVSIQRDENVITVFDVVQTAGGPQMLRSAVLDPGPGSEPWAGVIGNDGNTAYVILRHSQEVVEVVDLRGTPHLGRRASTESEPTGIAITPSGASLYIANWNQGTLSKIRTADMSVDHAIDLNQHLAATNLLGPDVATMRTTRPGLAHPRGIVISDSGDTNDADETAYVTEFFSQGLPASEIPMRDGVPIYDQARIGIVYAVSLATEAVQTVRIAPVADTGFLDSRNEHTGCVPNQLQAPTLHDGKLYVTSTCASPDGPTDVSATDPSDTRNFKTLMHPVVFVIDTTTSPPAELPNSAMVLSREFQQLYDRIHESDEADNPFSFQCDGARRRIPLMPTDMAFVPGTNDFFVSSYGTAALFRVSLDATGRLAAVGRDETPGHLQYVDLVISPPRGEQAHLPTGFAIGNTHTEMMVASGDDERNVAIVNIPQHAATGFVPAVATDSTGVPPAEQARRDGRRFFASGTGRWGYRAQGWSSCEGCHPDGLTDNVTWFFRRGPRQSPSLAATYGTNDGRRMMSWTASFDEIQDLESITRHLQGGVGSFVHAMSTPAAVSDRITFEMTPAGGNPTGAHATPTPQDFLNGSSAFVSHGGGDFDPSVAILYDHVKTFVETLRAPRPPVHIEDLAEVGREVFMSHGCQGCHGSDRWTVSHVFYQPNEITNNPISGTLRNTMFTLPPGFPAALSPVAMRGGGTASLRYNDANPMNWAGNDQLNCALRSVGTFGAAGTHFAGIAPPDVAVNELRHNMTLVAQGADGFNPPSLIGVGAGGPYLHAGNARTLEELLLSPAFQQHRQALVATPIAEPDVAPLVAFLLSIDKHTTAPRVDERMGGMDVDLCE